MSEPGRDSIPTSADPRSKRPTKKRALSPASQQAQQVSHLFAHPDREIKIPAGPRPRTLPPPPEIVANVQGSSAGAGSGEFHVYKASRRREYERLRLMDEEVAREKAQEEYERKMEELRRKDEEKTGKNRRRRMKKKEKEKGKGRGADAKDEEMADVPHGEGKAEADGKSSEKVDGKADGGSDAVEGGTAEENGLVIHDDD